MGSSFILLIIGLISVVYSQVLGIDFGTQFWKAALISPGKNLVIVENSRSERKTLNSIAFQDGVRYFEDDSKSKRLKKPQLSYFYLNKLIRSLDGQKPLDGYTYTDNTYVFQTSDKSMTLEQVVGMILKNIKVLASHQAGTDIRDVVLSVPSNWGFKAKTSLVNAANLADFSVLGLINQNSAAAIQYAISRNDSDPINVVIFNYGSENLQISVIKAYGFFDEGKNKTIQSIEALSHITVQDVGGLKVDQAIANYLANQFQKKHKLDAKKNKKSFTKLLLKSAQAKQTLSANKDTQVYVQGLIDGIDLNLPLKREIIEDCTHFNHFNKYLDQALQKAGVTKPQIHSVEIIGGASRIPKVGSIIKQYFKQYENVQVGSHINGDESVAFGSALRAANLSLTFRVKQLHYYDPMNLDTKVIISSPDRGVIFEDALFQISDHHGAKRSINLQHSDEDIKITVYVGEQIVKQYATKGLGDWKKKHQKDNITGTPNLIIDLMMNSVHVAEIKDAYINLTLNVTSIRQKVQYVEQEVQVEQVVKVNQKEKKSEQGEQTENKEANEDNTSESKQNNETESETKTIKKKVNKTKTVKNLIEQHEIKPKKHIFSFEQTFSKYKRFSKQQVEEKRKLLHEFEAHEKEIKQKAKIRNDFQAALYHLKDSFDQKYMKTFGKEAEVSRLIDTVTTELQWLQENAWTATKHLFEEHFKTLTDAYHPIYNRTTEYQNREKSYNQTFGYLGMVYQRTSDLVNTHPWIKQKVQMHLKKVNDTAQWISQKLKKQIERPLNQDPLIYNHEMIQKAQQLRNEYYKLKMTPRPKIDDFMKDFAKKMEEEAKKAKEESNGQNSQAEEQKKDSSQNQSRKQEQSNEQRQSGNAEEATNEDL